LKEGAKILVAYDGSEYSKRALKEASDIAKKFSGSVTLLHIFWDPKVTQFEGTEIRDMPTLRLLADVEKELKEAKIKYEMRSERSDDPPSVILRIAKEEGFDCIALGSRGVGGAKAWLLGSVSSKVVAEATCPVIVTK
jgi:nucleotide-binding universal stress UspA family protein